MRTSSVLVAGAAGFIGSSVVDALLAAGSDVVGIDNFDRFYPAAIRRANLRAAKKNSRFQLEGIDVRDGAAVAEVCRRHRPHTVFCLAATLPYTVKTIKYVLGTTARIERLSPQRGDLDQTWADVSAAARELGFSPRVSLADGVGRFVEWWRSRGREWHAACAASSD